MRLGMVGTGMMAGFVLPHIKGWGVDLRAICGSGRDPAKTAARADEYGIDLRFDDYRELIACYSYHLYGVVARNLAVTCINADLKAVAKAVANVHHLLTA